MTDEEIKLVVCEYITVCFDSDNADGLHEMDEFYYPDGDFDDTAYLKALKIYRKAKVTVTFDD